MAERPMETTLCTALWQQFGAAIDMLENALLACPDALWHERLWGDPSLPPGFASFWYVTSHTLFWLDLYLTGSPEGFAPPAPFDPDDDLPERPYTREELHAYLLQLRQKCQTIITELSYEQAQQQVDLPWRRKPSYFELLLYILRHVQEHAAQSCSTRGCTPLASRHHLARCPYGLSLHITNQFGNWDGMGFMYSG